MAAKTKTHRRQFLRSAARLAAGAVAVPYFVPGSALGKDGATVPSDRIVMGSIATGGRGSALLRGWLGLSDSHVVAVCDVKKPARDRAKARVDQRYGGSGCTSYTDFRELLARDDIDAVTVASPDHWHVPLAAAAVRAGKDVYCEKPLGLSVQQGTELRRLVRQYGAVFQFGTQERSAWSTHLACTIVRNQWIGELKKVTVSSRFSRASGNYPTEPVPDWLDYDLWLGPAPWAPYTPNRVLNNHWFHISDYALGFIAGCGIHTVDMAMWGMGTDRTGPVEVEGIGEFPPDGLCNCATGWDVNLTFANGVVMNFTDGKRNPLGVRFEGTDGWVFVKEKHLGGTVTASSNSLLKKKPGPNDVHLRSSSNHGQDFLEAIKNRSDPVAPIEGAVRGDAICQLSDAAMRLGRKLHWDPDAERFVNDSEADRMLVRPMRDPWRL